MLEYGATAMQATPATWHMLLDAGWGNGTSHKALCGGEDLPIKLAARLVAAGASAWNLYGPTETTIWSALKRLNAENSVTIGRPIANAQLRVLDSSLQLLPIGVPGELY